MAYDRDSTEGRFLAGDPEAVAEVIRWVARTLASPSLWSLRSSKTDLVQEVTGRVIESLRSGRFDPSRGFRVYVQGIARFTAFKAIGRESREVNVGDRGSDYFSGIHHDGTSPDTEVDAVHVARRALELSTEECRSLISDYFLDEMNFREISADRSIPVGTVKSRLFRCMEALRKVIGFPKRGNTGGAGNFKK